MLELPRSIQEILASVGVSQEHVRTFKFGGIIGKVALVALGGFAAVVGVAKFAGGTNQLICVGAILVTVLLVVAGIVFAGLPQGVDWIRTGCGGECNSEGRRLLQQLAPFAFCSSPHKRQEQ